MRYWMMAAVALTMAVPASAQVTLKPGQRVTVTYDANGAGTPRKVRKGKPAPSDLDALGQMRGIYTVNPPKPGEVAAPVAMNAGGGKPLPEIAPDQVQILFFIDGTDSVLALQNGYRRGVTYRATIYARGRSAPTDVCLVMPGKRGYEHWPFVIDKIELTEFRMEDWDPNTPLPCR